MHWGYCWKMAQFWFSWPQWSPTKRIKMIDTKINAPYSVYVKRTYNNGSFPSWWKLLFFFFLQIHIPQSLCHCSCLFLLTVLTIIYCREQLTSPYVSQPPDFSAVFFLHTKAWIWSLFFFLKCIHLSDPIIVGLIRHWNTPFFNVLPTAPIELNRNEVSAWESRAKGEWKAVSDFSKGED